MKMKSYFAESVQDAMALAREELGPEAMLVQSKRARADTRPFAQYEVVFALEDSAAAPLTASAPATGSGFGQVFASQRDIAIHELSAELEQLKRRIDGISGPAISSETHASTAEFKTTGKLARLLEEADLDPEIAKTIARQALAEGGELPALRKAIEGLVRVDSTLGVANASRKLVALVGPPGAGKTTALVKLATRYGLAARRSVHLVSTDIYRVGAAEQLRLYASILGVGFQTAESPLALAQALEEQRHKELIFIDTPGRGYRDLPEIQDLANYIGNDPEIDVHLVLPASNRARDLAKTVDRYAIFRPAKLLFTRIDETGRLGPMLNESYRTGKPVSYLSAGEQIPEDLEPATTARIAELICGPLFPGPASQPGTDIEVSQ